MILTDSSSLRGRLAAMLLIDLVEEGGDHAIVAVNIKMIKQQLWVLIGCYLLDKTDLNCGRAHAVDS